METLFDFTPLREGYPFSSFGFLLAGSFLYAIFAFLGIKLVERHPSPFLPSKVIRALSFIHNLIMCSFSYYVGHYMIVELLNIKHSLPSNANSWMDVLYDSSCKNLETPLMNHLFNVFFLSKYYEAIDTLMLFVRGKRPIFLHVFHHTVTPAIVFATWVPTWLPIAWVGPLTNSWVHVLMYAYYAGTDFFPSLRSFGFLVTWIQLIQFMTCIFVLLLGWALGTYPLSHPGGLYVGACYVAFLYLFVEMYQAKKKEAAARSRQRREAAKKTS